MDGPLTSHQLGRNMHAVALRCQELSTNGCAGGRYIVIDVACAWRAGVWESSPGSGFDEQAGIKGVGSHLLASIKPAQGQASAQITSRRKAMDTCRSS